MIFLLQEIGKNSTLRILRRETRVGGVYWFIQKKLFGLFWVKAIQFIGIDAYAYISFKEKGEAVDFIAKHEKNKIDNRNNVFVKSDPI